MQKAELLPLARRLQRRLQPSQLPPEHLFVVRPAFVLLVEPAARPAERHVAIKVAVVVQDLHVGESLLRAEFIEFRRRRPPVVVVSLQQDLPARNGADEREVLLRLLDAERPAQIARQDGRVLRPDDGQPPDAYGFRCYIYRGNGNAVGFAWLVNSASAGLCTADTDYSELGGGLGGITLTRPIAFAVTMRNGVMGVTMRQEGKTWHAAYDFAQCFMAVRKKAKPSAQT